MDRNAPTKFNSQAVLTFLGVVAVSLSWGLGAPFAWLASQSLSPGEITWARCGLACLTLSPFLFLDGQTIMRALSLRGRALLFSSGIVLGIHFYLFISGLVYASLATVVTLVAVEPAIIFLVGVLGFKEKVRPTSILGLLLCLIGIFIISTLPHLLAKKLGIETRSIYGDICAVFAVLTYGLYYALNRAFPLTKLTHKLSVSAHPLRLGFSLGAVIYFFATISSGTIALVASWKGSEKLILPSVHIFFTLVGIAVIPTVLGHTLNQIISRRAHPIWISLMSPGETLFALFFGFVFLNQTISSFELIGGFFILVGAGITAWSESNNA